MPADVIVLGAGGHARVVIDALRSAGHSVAGVCAPELAQGQSGPLGVPAIGDEAALAKLGPAKHLLANGVGSVGKADLRKALFERWTAQGWRFITVTHPSAVVGSECVLAEGAQVMAGAVLQPGVHVGKNSIVNTSASIDHDCRIGDHVHIAPGVVLSGNVAIGAGSHLGTGAVVIHGINIGAGCLIGAGAVVTQAVAPGGHVKAGERY